MPEQIQASLALQHIDAVVALLQEHFDTFDWQVQDQIGGAYAHLRDEYPVDGTPYLQGMVVARFLQVLDGIPAVRDVVGSLIDATRGPARRSGPSQGDSALLTRLPPGLHGISMQSAGAIPPAPPFPPAAAPPLPTAAVPLELAPPPRGEDEAAEGYSMAEPATVTRSQAAEASADSAAQAQPSLTRYPNLDCPSQAIIGQKVSLFVQLLVEPVDPQAQAMQIEDTGAAEELPEVELVLRAPGFDFQGSNTRTLEIDRGGDSEERFVLIPRRLGEQTIRVDFYQHGRRIGTERRNMLVVEELQTVEVAQPAHVGPLDFTSQPILLPPDLELTIELDQHDGRTLIFGLHSTSAQVGYNHAKVGAVTLQGSPLEKMQAVYGEMSRMARVLEVTADEQRLAEMRLAAVGNDLWEELIPEELKRQYWRFRTRVKTILITSDEPWVPWEMLKPHRITDEGEREEDDFWCRQFAIARWLSGPCAADELPVGAARPVAPTHVNLPSVREEVSFIEQLNSLRPEMVPLASFSQRLQVMDALKTGGFSVLHFACHGQFDATLPNDSAISLGDGPLRPSDIRAYLGKGPRPLIFINACHGGRIDMSFTGLGGWADRLVKDVCVGAFIGALWEVNDTLALQFARRFYTELLKHQAPIAAAFLAAREEIRQAAPANSTWLAYVLYADPLARMQPT